MPSKKDNNLPTKFDIDPAELMTNAYVKLGVADKILEIAESSNLIVTELAKVSMDKQVIELPIVKTLLSVETLTLSSLYKQIVYHSHMIDSMMRKADDHGDIDVGMFFQISELSSRSTDLMSKFTIFLRTLPQHLQRLNNDLIQTIDIDDDSDDDLKYVTGSAGDEELISRIDRLVIEMKDQHKDILDKDLDSDLDFDPNDISDDDSPAKPKNSMDPDDY